MSIRVDERVYLDAAEAEAWLPDGDTINTRLQPLPGVLVGADWEREQVLDLIRTSTPEESGPVASAEGYGLCVVYADGGALFIESKRPEPPRRDRITP
jgi:hypothetical protein